MTFGKALPNRKPYITPTSAKRNLSAALAKLAHNDRPQPTAHNPQFMAQTKRALGSNRGFCLSSAINRETRNFNFKFKASNFRFPSQGEEQISRFSTRIPSRQLPHFPTWPIPISG